MSHAADVGKLHATGRSSGLVRAVQLRYGRKSGGIILVRLGGSGERWPLNLLAYPDCEFVTGDGNSIQCRAVWIEDGSFRLVPR